MVFLNLEVISCQPHKYQCLGLIILAPIIYGFACFSYGEKADTSFHYFVNTNNSCDTAPLG